MPSKQTTPPPDRAAPRRPNHHANNGLGRQRVTDIQRARMLAAMTEAACEHGTGNVTVAHVVERAGVSRRTFYEVFDDIGDCLLAAIDEAVSRACARVLPAYRTPGRWRERIRASLAALLQLFDDEPFTGRLLVVETLAGGHAALERRNRVLAQLVAAVDEGRREARDASASTRLTAEGAVGGVISVLHARLLESERRGTLLELLNPLMSMLVLPYLGSAAARRELRQPPAAIERQPSVLSAQNPLKRLEMRLTYRTVRVLTAVAASPGASNRAVGVASGIGDQGQISKLLARLEKLGLVSNTGLAPGQGAANAWRLTDRGQEVWGAVCGGDV